MSLGKLYHSWFYLWFWTDISTRTKSSCCKKHKAEKSKNEEEDTRHEDKIVFWLMDLDDFLLDKQICYSDKKYTDKDNTRIYNEVIEMSGFNIHPEEACYQCEGEHEC